MRHNKSTYVPKVVGIEITKSCYCLCKYCGARTAQGLREDIVDEQMCINIISQMKALGIPFLRITGGEPLDDPHTAFITQLAHDVGIEAIKMNTSLQIPRRDTIGKLVESLCGCGFGQNKKHTSIMSVGFGPHQASVGSGGIVAWNKMDGLIKSIIATQEVLQTNRLKGLKVNLELHYFHTRHDVDNLHNQLGYSNTGTFLHAMMATFPSQCRGLSLCAKELVLSRANTGGEVCRSISSRQLNLINKVGNCIQCNNLNWVGPVLFVRSDGRMSSCMTWCNEQYGGPYFLGYFPETCLEEAVSNANQSKCLATISEKGVRCMALDFLADGNDIQIDPYITDPGDICCEVCKAVLFGRYNTN